MPEPAPPAAPPEPPSPGRRRVYVSLNPALTDSPLRRALYDNGARPAPTPDQPTPRKDT